MKSEEYSYITNSRNIVLKVKRFQNSIKGVSVSAYYGDRMALVAPYKAYVLTPEKAEDFVVQFCNMVHTFTDKEIQDHAEADKVMIALNIKQSLKTVRTRNGRTIWRKK